MAGDDWLGGIDDGWLEPSDAERQPPRPPSGIGGRRMVEVVCCERCESLAAHCVRRESTLSRWQCGTCGHTWKEGPDLGQAKAVVVSP